jgi:glyoxylase-like metal-dependent hydrolase (beta-lactamase superfamily II)
MSASLRCVPISDRLAGWAEVADGCFVGRHEHLDVNTTLLVGGEAALLVDTRASLMQGRELAEHVRRVTPRPLSYVINTHVHFDHLFGNGAFTGVPIVAHESVPSALPAHSERIRALYVADRGDQHREEVLTTQPVPPDTTFSSVWATDLGDRLVELVFLGRGHTDGDIVVRVPDADLVCAGDLVEESGPPGYGPDSWPLEWGLTLEQLSNVLGRSTVVVPGHGALVDKGFVLDQRLDVVDVAEQIHALKDRRVPVEEALAAGRWPFPVEGLADAVARGYEIG